MKKWKICVYAITKNEEKFVNRWYNSMKEADEIYVLDTGSTDNTRKILKELGVKVKRKFIKPWRFDKARNEALKLVPTDTDICVSTDLDEVFIPGWRKKLETIWDSNTTQLSYNYNWQLDNNDKPLVSFYRDKIHTRNDFIWTHPVHEILTYIGNKPQIKKLTDNITLNHYPDTNKSRSSYLSLLELSVKEEPNDDRNMHYLGREYMYYGRWNEAIDTLIKHLKLKSATWKDERCASMRFIARCYKMLKRYDEAYMWLAKAIKEAPYLRDAYMEKALLDYELDNYKDLEISCLGALNIKTNQKTYINEIFTNDITIYDLLSLSYYYQNKYKDSYTYIKLALDINPNDKRLKNNYQIIKEKAKSNK